MGSCKVAKILAYVFSKLQSQAGQRFVNIIEALARASGGLSASCTGQKLHAFNVGQRQGVGNGLENASVFLCLGVDYLKIIVGHVSTLLYR